MHDIKERLEVGVLDFSLVAAPGTDDLFIGLQSVPLVPTRVWKLVLSVEDLAVESGLAFESTAGCRITVVAGANPYTLAIDGVPTGEHGFEPEYALDRYAAHEFL
jgi:hypothetical protein